MLEKQLHTMDWRVTSSAGIVKLQQEPIHTCEFPPSRKRLSPKCRELLEEEIVRRKLTDTQAFELERTFTDVSNYYYEKGINQEDFMNNVEYYVDKFYSDIKMFDELCGLTLAIFPLLFEETR